MPISDRQLRLHRASFFGPLLPAVALGTIAILRGQLQIAPFLAVLAYGVAAWVSMTTLHRRGAPLQWFLSLALLNLFVVLPETALRAAAFRFEAGIEFGYPRPEMLARFKRHPELFWVLDPAAPGVNAWGCRGPEVVTPKPDGVFRILFLGDSCTFAGEPPYPSRVENMLNQAPSGKRVECVSLSTAGYSSHQGLAVARTYGALVDPDLVVVYYGWNDHWLAYGAVDSEKKIDPTPGLLERASERLRLLQLMGWLRGRGEPLDRTRVSTEEYRANLTEIARLFEPEQVPIVFITAPTSHRKLGVDGVLLEMNFARDTESVMRLHEEYVEIVREVAAEQSSTRRILDLQQEFGALSDRELDEIFTHDGIHFETKGMDRVAARLASFFATQFEFGK